MSFLDKVLDIKDEKNISGLNTELKSIYIYQKFKKEKKSIIYVTSNLNDASNLYNSITHYTDKVWFFPMDDFLTSEAIAISPEFKTSRLETINNILKKEKQIIITNLMGYLRYLPEIEIFKKSYIKLEKEKEYPLKKLEEKLNNIGYKKETIVTMTGEVAPRGFVIDIFPVNIEYPIRIEYWDDIIDKIKIFDINSQRTIKEIEEITIFPNTEKLINNSFDIPYREMPNHIKTTNIAGLMDHIMIYDNLTDIKNNYLELKEEIKNYNISVGRKETTKYMFDFEELYEEDSIKFEIFDNIKNAKKINTNQIDIFPKTPKEINERLNLYIKKQKKVIICLDNRYQINRLIENLENPNIVFTNENEIYKGKINIIIKNINEGFETDKYIVITNKELFNKKRETQYKTKFRYGSKIKDITKLNIGDYVVHGAHGIGRYEGIKTIQKQGIKKDYLSIQYKDNDKLYIPVEKLELITKYSGKEGITPKLNKLGSHDWEKTKARARKKAEDIAEDLLKLYAVRESKIGFAFNEDDKDQINFEKEFKYEETKDQLKVIEEIKKDMQSN